MEPVRVISRVTVEDDMSLFCEKGKSYDIISYDLDNNLMTIEVENEEWLQTTMDDPDFLIVHEEED